ncbi:hypothetical protein [Lentzea sp. E54]|uniref:hypothetical protein n=1 Tax=Lentzea xerophila TaxID=3435883 RepID=UPI003DA5B1FA
MLRGTPLPSRHLRGVGGRLGAVVRNDLVRVWVPVRHAPDPPGVAGLGGGVHAGLAAPRADELFELGRGGRQGAGGLLPGVPDLALDGRHRTAVGPDQVAGLRQRGRRHPALDRHRLVGE